MQNNNQDNGRIYNSENNANHHSVVGFVHKKTEKLVTAVYMLSNFFPHEEPLKWKVRNTSLCLLSGISAVFYGTEGEHQSIFKEQIKTISEIIVFLELAHVSGLISNMNFLVLKDEFLSLKREIEINEKKGHMDNLLLTSDFFSSPKLLEDTAKEDSSGPLRTDLKPALHLEPKAHSDPALIFSGPSQPKQEIKQKNLAQERQKNKGHEENGSVVSQRKNDRSEAILKLLRKKDNLTIKDISHVISGCSEKTIQRELLALVEKNVLKKIGERRWSRYSLA